MEIKSNSHYKQDMTSSGLTISKESVELNYKLLFISPSEDKKVVFEESLQLLDTEGQLVDAVTVAVESSPLAEDSFMVYQYSEDHNRLLRVKSHVNRNLDTESEARWITRLEKTTTLRITDCNSEYKVLKVSVEGRGGSRQKLDIPKSPTEKLMLEGSNIVLLRKIAVSRLFGHFHGQTITHDGELCVCDYESGEDERGNVWVRRTVGLEVMTTLLTAEGRILQHKWSGSEWRLESSGLSFQQTEEPVDQPSAPSSQPELKADQAAYFDKKVELISLMREYLRDHLGVQDMIADFLKNVLFEKPDDVIDFADRFFSEFLDIVRNPEESEVPNFSIEDLNTKNSATGFE